MERHATFPPNEEKLLIQWHCGCRKSKAQYKRHNAGITAGTVPDGGHILNIEKMNKITGLRCDNDEFIHEFNLVY